MDNTIKTSSLKLILLFVSISIIFCSCRQETSNSSVTEPITNTKEVVENEFERKLKNEPKIFLKYWSGMTYSEYYDVSQILVKEGVLKKDGFQFSYLTNNCRVPLETVKKDDLIIGIKLTENIDCIYSLYQEKYGLPNMVYKDLLLSYFIENNPKYNPVSSYFNGTQTTYLPDCFIDKTSFLSTNQPQKLDTSNLSFKFPEKILPQDEFIIENTSNVIIIEQEIKRNKLISYTYSLEESDEMNRYKNSEVGQKHFGIYSIGSKDSQSEYLIQNSKTRTGMITAYKEISITYKSKKDYYDELQKQKRELLNEQELELKRKQDKKELEKRIYDQI